MNTNKLNQILVGIIGGLALVILVGTVVGLTQKKAQEPEVLISKGKAENLAPPADTNVVAYYDLGKIRVVTAAPENQKESKTKSSDNENALGTPMVLNPWLAYPEGDTVFYEELARKQGVLKGIFQTYFTSHTKNDLLSATETVINKELLEQINAQLSLGKVLDIYFTDYLFLE